MRFFAAAILAVALAAPGAPTAPAVADDGKPTLDELVAANTHSITFADGKLGGAGADWLRREGKRVHFFMLGEQHATADIAELSSALFRELNQTGYQRAAVEVGPWSTPVLEKLLRSPDGQAFRDYLAGEGRSLTFPFFFYQEEMDFGRAVVESSTLKRDALWGVDQEFIAAGPVVLELLAGWADTRETKAAVAAAQEQCKQDVMLLGSGDEAIWQALHEAFDGSGNADARRLLDEVDLSRRIYSPFVGRGGNAFTGNEERERYMKTNFHEQLSRAMQGSGTPPKIFFKFGANHVMYGHSPTHVLTFGTFVRDLGLALGVETVNVHVDCMGGEIRDPRSGATSACSSYFVGETGELRDHVDPEGITLIDLRGLRPHAKLWRGWDERTRRLILGYDAYVVIPDPRAAGLVVPPGTE